MLRHSISTFLARGASRKPMTSKDGNRHYYKGNRCGAMGKWMERHWNYRIDPQKVRRFCVPELKMSTTSSSSSSQEFKLTPYVPWSLKKPKEVFNASSFLVSSENTSSSSSSS
ncbi:hypothetical protein HMI54_010280 [Coelomomyces lativittatus]|nr:hypothetical protein HMI56_003148 [Coelomomyces lativittatus]KAJ1516247.1 hypothetical protein HMI54_010280 [Coelomomyces lativittatus]